MSFKFKLIKKVLEKNVKIKYVLIYLFVQLYLYKTTLDKNVEQNIYEYDEIKKRFIIKMDTGRSITLIYFNKLKCFK